MSSWASQQAGRAAERVLNTPGLSTDEALKELVRAAGNIGAICSVLTSGNEWASHQVTVAYEHALNTRGLPTGEIIKDLARILMNVSVMADAAEMQMRRKP